MHSFFSHINQKSLAGNVGKIFVFQKFSVSFFVSHKVGGVGMFCTLLHFLLFFYWNVLYNWICACETLIA